MTTLFLTHPTCSLHEMGGSPEQPARLAAIEQILQTEEFDILTREDCPKAAVEQIERAHPQAHISLIREHTPTSGYAVMDGGDTLLCPHSYEAALRAAGGAVRAVDAVMGGEARNAFCAIRPPGHHAERQQAMGFCLFNNAAIAALHARAEYGAERVAVVDFDVHHGNGTQNIFWEDEDMFYGSTHQAPFYPGSGDPDETGVGNIFNAPLPEGADGEMMLEAFEQLLLPELSDFSPDLMVISAGFDAHEADPLAGLRVQTQDFRRLTQMLVDYAAETCCGRIVSVLEGGYDLQALSQSVAAHVEVLIEAGL